MSFSNDVLLDGYSLNNADGYSFVTPWFDVKNAFSCSFSVNFTAGSPSGTLTLEASNEPPYGVPGGLYNATVNGVSNVNTIKYGEQPHANGLDATTVSGTSTSISATGNTLFNVAYPGYRWIRAKYIATSGTSTVTVTATAKW